MFHFSLRYESSLGGRLSLPEIFAAITRRRPIAMADERLIRQSSNGRIGVTIPDEIVTGAGERVGSC